MVFLFVWIAPRRLDNPECKYNYSEFSALFGALLYFFATVISIRGNSLPDRRLTNVIRPGPSHCLERIVPMRGVSGFDRTAGRTCDSLYN